MGTIDYVLNNTTTTKLLFDPFDKQYTRGIAAGREGERRLIPLEHTPCDPDRYVKIAGLLEYHRLDHGLRLVHFRYQ